MLQRHVVLLLFALSGGNTAVSFQELFLHSHLSYTAKQGYLVQLHSNFDVSVELTDTAKQKYDQWILHAWVRETVTKNVKTLTFNDSSPLKLSEVLALLQRSRFVHPLERQLNVQLNVFGAHLFFELHAPLGLDGRLSYTRGGHTVHWDAVLQVIAQAKGKRLQRRLAKFLLRSMDASLRDHKNIGCKSVLRSPAVRHHVDVICESLRDFLVLSSVAVQSNPTENFDRQIRTVNEYPVPVDVWTYFLLEQFSEGTAPKDIPSLKVLFSSKAIFPYSADHDASISLSESFGTLPLSRISSSMSSFELKAMESNLKNILDIDINVDKKPTLLAPSDWTVRDNVETNEPVRFVQELYDTKLTTVIEADVATLATELQNKVKSELCSTPSSHKPLCQLAKHAKVDFRYIAFEGQALSFDVLLRPIGNLRQTIVALIDTQMLASIRFAEYISNQVVFTNLVNFLGCHCSLSQLFSAETLGFDWPVAQLLAEKALCMIIKKEGQERYPAWEPTQMDRADWTFRAFDRSSCCVHPPCGKDKSLLDEILAPVHEELKPIFLSSQIFNRDPMTAVSSIDSLLKVWKPSWDDAHSGFLAAYEQAQEIRKAKQAIAEHKILTDLLFTNEETLFSDRTRCTKRDEALKPVQLILYDTGETVLEADGQSIYTRCPSMQKVFVEVGERLDVSLLEFLGLLRVGVPQIPNSSLGLEPYLTVHGNQFSNSFFSLQQTVSPTCILCAACQERQMHWNGSMLNEKPFYSLHGHDGNDVFFFDKQFVELVGGSGRDVYVGTTASAYATLKNYDPAQTQDVLYLSVAHDTVCCHRVNDDLLIGFCGVHRIILQLWFLGADYRHLTIVTNDDMTLAVQDVGIGENGEQLIECVVKSVDFGARSELTRFDARNTKYKYVDAIVGSDYTDVMVGNAQENIIISGLGSDNIAGRDGSDVYVINADEGCPDYIENYATDDVEDLLMYNVPYSAISLERGGADLILKTSDTSCVHIIRWFAGHAYQHLKFLSADGILFSVVVDQKQLKKEPLIFPKYSWQGNRDFAATYKHGLVAEGSRYNETLIGNDLANVLQCDGADYLKGLGDTDVYSLPTTCRNVRINNSDPYRNVDLLMFEAEFHRIHLQEIDESQDLRFYVLRGNFVDNYTLVGYFKHNHYQHAVVQSGDGVTALLPPRKNLLRKFRWKPRPVEVRNVVCENETVDLSEFRWREVTRYENVIPCSDRIVGNALGNYIDVGEPTSDDVAHETAGGNGSDTYIVNSKYGTVKINNFADDGVTDLLWIKVSYDQINIYADKNDIIVEPTEGGGKARVVLHNYRKNKRFEHLLVLSSDNVVFEIAVPKKNKPFKRVVLVDFQNSLFSRTLKLANSTLNSAVILGADRHPNYFEGSARSRFMAGGRMNDIIIGGPAPQKLYGFAGSDRLTGGKSGDVIFGGSDTDTLSGAAGNDIFVGGWSYDLIRGGSGFDAIVFSGNATDKTGVQVSLMTSKGIANDADQDSYEGVEVVYATEYNDILEGNENTNVLVGFDGSDLFLLQGSLDITCGGNGADRYKILSQGWKIINNFATDREVDIILFPGCILEYCFYTVGDDLLMRIGYARSRSNLGCAGIIVVHLAILNWLKGDQFQHLEIRLSTDNTLIPIFPLYDVNEWLDRFFKEQLFEVTDVSTNDISLTISDKLRVYPDWLSFALVYEDDASTKLHRVELSLAKLEQRNFRTDLHHLHAGSMAAMSMLLICCQQTVAASTPDTVRLLPEPPGIIRVLEIDSGSVTLGWSAPEARFNPNVHLYRYRVEVIDRSSNFRTVQFTPKNTTDIVVRALNSRTAYDISVQTAAGNTLSEMEVIVVRTLSICHRLLIPANAYFVEEAEENDHITAELACKEGYTLALHENRTGNISIAAENVVRISCSQQIPCVNSSCAQLVTCIKSQCAALESEQWNIKPALVHTTYHHGDVGLFECYNNHKFLDYDTHFLRSTCWGGNWQPEVPKCVPYSVCAIPSIANGYAETHDGVMFRANATAIEGTSVYYRCELGYDLQGPSTASCRDYTWHPADTVQCNAVGCPQLTNHITPREPKHGDETYLRSATLHCRNDLTVYDMCDELVLARCWLGRWVAISADLPRDTTCEIQPSSERCGYCRSEPVLHHCSENGTICECPDCLEVCTCRTAGSMRCNNAVACHHYSSGDLYCGNSVECSKLGPDAGKTFCEQAKRCSATGLGDVICGSAERCRKDQGIGDVYCHDAQTCETLYVDGNLYCGQSNTCIKDGGSGNIQCENSRTTCIGQKV